MRSVHYSTSCLTKNRKMLLTNSKQLCNLFRHKIYSTLVYDMCGLGLVIQDFWRFCFISAQSRNLLISVLASSPFMILFISSKSIVGIIFFHPFYDFFLTTIRYLNKMFRFSPLFHTCNSQRKTGIN